MTIKISIALILFLQMSFIGFAQTNPSVDNTIAEVIEKQKLDKDQITCTDSVYGLSTDTV